VKDKKESFPRKAGIENGPPWESDRKTGKKEHSLLSSEKQEKGKSPQRTRKKSVNSEWGKKKIRQFLT